jgi:hypothetical protein
MLHQSTSDLHGGISAAAGASIAADTKTQSGLMMNDSKVYLHPQKQQTTERKREDAPNTRGLAIRRPASMALASYMLEIKA